MIFRRAKMISPSKMFSTTIPNDPIMWQQQLVSDQAVLRARLSIVRQASLGS